MKSRKSRHNRSKMMRLVREILYIMKLRSRQISKCFKCLRINENGECRCKSYDCVANDANAKHGYLICMIHIAGVSLSAGPDQFIFSFKFGLICHICPACCGNVNTNAGESLQTSYDHLQTSYDHYKCLAINENGLRLLTNMSRICFSYEF